MSLPTKALRAQNQYRSLLLFLAAASASLALGQDRLSLEQVVSRGLATSPHVRSAETRVSAAEQAIARSRAGFNPHLELAPGVGFTNSNFALSQRFDIGGVRRAETRLAEAELQTARAQLQVLRQARAFEVATAYFELLRGRAEEAAAVDSARLTRDLLELVKKRVEIGEAPQVQVTRAQIETDRIEQELVRTRGSVEARLAALRILLDDQALQANTVPAELPTEPGASDPAALVSQALTNRGDLQRLRSLVEQARAEGGIARSARRPSLIAGIAADTWSLDRDPFHSRNLGFQVLLSAPLFDRGSFSAEERRASLMAKAAEEEVAGLEQQVRAEVVLLTTELDTRRQVASNYRSKILPNTQSLVEATRRGYEDGLITLIDVLDAQRTARLTQTEFLTALHEAIRAELELRRAAGTLAPMPQDAKENSK